MSRLKAKRSLARFGGRELEGPAGNLGDPQRALHWDAHRQLSEMAKRIVGVNFKGSEARLHGRPSLLVLQERNRISSFELF